MNLLATIVSFFGLVGLFTVSGVHGADRPNFLWILSEDNSIHYLRLYGNPLGVTPTIEGLAEDGIVFDRAFSCGPVCSVARTTLMTGIYAPRGGFQYHRKSKLANLPGGLKMWPAYLRNAGYYTTNNRKKDYNVVEGEGVWDESSRVATWRNRPSKESPFFHMESTSVSHESSLHFKRDAIKVDELQTPIDQVKLAPYHPDTPTFRYTYARYHDRIRRVDEHVAALMAKLKADGLLEDTFVFYFGDHGGVLPRSKGYAYESGLHVPLVVRIPENWKHLVPVKRGSRTGDFVEFVDFGPTVLTLAGLKVPGELDGKPFLGSAVFLNDLNARDEAFGYADRFDEKYDMVRSLRKGKFKYIRNYQPFYPDGLQNNYRYIMLAYSEWRQLFRDGKLNEVQSQFFKPRPPEQLFDIEDDPHEINNLARNPEFVSVLQDLRQRLRARIEGIHDLSFYPESHMVEHALHDGIAFGEAHAAEIDGLIEIADLALRPFDESEEALREALSSSNPWERYWALITCSSFGELARSMIPSALDQLRDKELLVRMRAAEFLGIVGERDPRPVLYQILNQTDSHQEALITLNTAVFFNDRSPAYPFDLTQLELKEVKGEVERRILYFQGGL